MTKKHVYSIQTSNDGSEDYYETIKFFYPYALNHIESQAGPFLTSYQEFCFSHDRQIRSREEYALDILIFAIFWFCYGEAAVRSSFLMVKLAAILTRLRAYSSVKKIADRFRSILSYKLLPQRKGLWMFSSPKNIRKFWRYLAVTPEFAEERKRVSHFIKFFTNLREENQAYLFSLLKQFSLWFSFCATNILQRYCTNLSDFATDERPPSDVQEMFLQKRSIEEYGLNFFGAELMNRVLKNDFLEKNKTLVLLPACMCDPEKGQCQAVEIGGELRCRSCSSLCQIGLLEKIGPQMGFQVKIVRHESKDFSEDIAQSISESDYALIGVACAASVLAGGLKARRNGISAQCVILDFPGCRHWGDKPAPTKINFAEFFTRLKGPESLEYRKYPAENGWRAACPSVHHQSIVR